MPNVIQTTNLVTDLPTALSITGFFETVLISPGVTVGTTSPDFTARAILLAGTNQTATIAGTIFGWVGLLSNEDFSEVNVVKGGLVASKIVGLDFNFLGAEVRNDGTIQSSAVAIRHAFGVKIQNTGSIIAQSAILSSGALDLFNTGTISGNNAILSYSSVSDSVVNAGTIRGNIELGGGDDVFDGSAGFTFGPIRLGSGNDSAIGGIGREVFLDGDGSDEIDAGGGNDEVWLAPDLAIDTVQGGAGIDTLDLRATGTLATITDLVQGFSRGNLIGNNFVAGFERVVGGDGLDRITGDDAGNTFLGGGGNDLLFGAAGDDLLLGGALADLLDGGAGDDRLIGGANRDTLTGGAGNDVIWGGANGDVMTGGLGTDRFLFAEVDEFEAALWFPEDRITDFTPGSDIIDLSRIDWNLSGPDNAFAFRGTAGITGAGQVAVRQEGTLTVIDVSWSGSSPGTIVLDRIELNGVVTLSAADFWL